MADNDQISTGFDPDMTAGTVEFKDGRKRDVLVSEIVDRISSGQDDLYEAGAVKVEAIGGGLARGTFDVSAGIDFDLDPIIALISDSDEYNDYDALRADVPYFILFDGETPPVSAQLWTCTKGTLLTTGDFSRWEPCPVEITRMNEDGTMGSPVTAETDPQIVQAFEKVGLDLDALVAFYDTVDGRYITFGDALLGMMVPRAAVAAASVDVPQLEAIAPIRHYEPNAKTTLVLTNPSLFNNSREIVVSKGGQLPLPINFGLSWAGGEPPANITTTKPIDRVDVQIIASVVSLKLAGNTTISPWQICRAMGIEKPTAEQQAETHSRFMKLRNVDGNIDWTEQARRWKITNPETGRPFTRAELKGHLIDANVFEGEDEGGNSYIRYQLLADPLTYQHAHLTNQVLNYPQRLKELKPIDQDGKRRKRVTGDQVVLRNEILSWVYRVKGKNNMRPTIDYDTLFTTAEIDASTADRRRTAVTFTNDYLRALQAEGIIEGFSVNAPGRSHKPKSVTLYVEKPR